MLHSSFLARSFSRTLHVFLPLYAYSSPILFFLPSRSLVESLSLSCRPSVTHTFFLSFYFSPSLSVACLDLSAFPPPPSAASRSSSISIHRLRRLLDLTVYLLRIAIYKLSATSESSFGFIKALTIQTLTSYTNHCDNFVNQLVEGNFGHRAIPYQSLAWPM